MSIRIYSRPALSDTKIEKGRKSMMRQFMFIVCAVLVAGLLAGCGDKPDTGHVGQIGPVGPQPLEGTPPPNLTVIEDTNAMVTKEYPLSGFTQVEISDGFDVNIRQGDAFHVNARFEETAVPYIQMEQVGDTLEIRLEDDRTYHMVNITLDVEITMPELTKLVLQDGADATVTGFGDAFESEVDFMSTLKH
jgi:hypothetical protein